MPSKIASRKNGKAGGRPKVCISDRIIIPDIQNVILTKVQYDRLLAKYGPDILKKSIFAFENWLSEGSEKSKKYLNKNHYAHFRSDGWLVNYAKYLLSKEFAEKSQNVNSFTNSKETDLSE